MNDYLRKNYCINKCDIESASNRIINILDKKKRAIMAHDFGKRRDAILGRTIAYMLNSAENDGVKKPLVLYVGCNKPDKLNRRNRVIYMGKFVSVPFDSKIEELEKIVHDDEKIVAVIVDNYDLVERNLRCSTDLMNFIDELNNKWRIRYEIIVLDDLFSSPVLLPFITFRVINSRFSKLVGVEGARDLPRLFFNTDGPARPTDEGFIIHKKIAEYVDVDMFNYLDKNNIILPEVHQHKSAEKEVRAVLNQIKNIDERDKTNIKKCGKRFHFILCNDSTKFWSTYWNICNDYAKYDHKNVYRIILCEEIKLFDEWSIKPTYKDNDDSKKTIIFIVNNNEFQLGPWHTIADEIKSISFLSATGERQYFPMRFKDFINACKFVYTAKDSISKNKIFVHYRSDYFNYDSYGEIEYLLKYLITRDLPYKFDTKILFSIFDSYMKLGSKNRKVSSTVTLKKTA